MGVYVRGKMLWIRYKDADGKWRDKSTELAVGQEDLANEAYAEIVRRVAAADDSQVVAFGIFEIRGNGTTRQIATAKISDLDSAHSEIVVGGITRSVVWGYPAEDPVIARKAKKGDLF